MSNEVNAAIIDDVIERLERNEERIGFTVRSAARALDVPVHTILLAVRRGLLQPRMLGRHSIITKDQLLQFYYQCPLPHDRKPRSKKET